MRSDSTSTMVPELNPPALDQAVAILKAGGLVAFPTETVYGLGADAENVEALDRLYTVKGRPKGHPVIVHIADAAQLPEWACEIPDNAFRLAEAFWPGPLTLILKRASRVPNAVTGGQDTVGIRVPNHPVTLALLRAFGGGVAGPSANRFGRLSPTSAAHVRADLGNDIDLILDGGDCAVGVESTIVAFQGERPVILRPGMITAEQIAAAIDPMEAKEPATLQGNSTISRAPGTLASHYAPFTPVELVNADALNARVASFVASGQQAGVLAFADKPDGWSEIVWHQVECEPDAYAQQLYARLRLLDARQLNRIFVEMPPDHGAWAAVADRLRRAAY